MTLAQIPGREAQQLINAESGQPLAAIDVIFPIVHGTLVKMVLWDAAHGESAVRRLRCAGLCSLYGQRRDQTSAARRRARRRPVYHTHPRQPRAVQLCRCRSEAGLLLFVKPANRGSSVGVSKVKNEEQYHQAVALAFEFDHKVVVEQGIKGREIECAVLGNDHPQASTCGEIVLNSEFYAYDTKYIDDQGAQVVVPAAIAPEINDKIRAIAVQAYQTLGCSGMARVDVFLTADNEVVINEINTLPGFTNISMYPKLWQASGLDYTSLITRLIELALERHAADRALKTSMN